MNTWPLQEGGAGPTQAFGEKLCEFSVQPAGWLWKKDGSLYSRAQIHCCAHVGREEGSHGNSSSHLQALIQGLSTTVNMTFSSSFQHEKNGAGLFYREGLQCKDVCRLSESHCHSGETTHASKSDRWTPVCLITVREVGGEKECAPVPGICRVYS